MVDSGLISSSKYLRNIVELPFLFILFLRNSSYQKKFLKKNIEIELNEHVLFNDGSLDKEDIKKIKLYGYAIPAMLGEAYCVLRNAKMTENERLTLSYLGAITGLFDDLFDKKSLSEEYINGLMTNSQQLVGDNSNEKLLIQFYNNALKNSQHPTDILKLAGSVFKAQLLSKKQKSHHISETELMDITFQKGGYSMLLYCTALNNKFEATEQQLIYKLGGIGQLENDIFDVYKDYQEGIRTLATIMNKTSELKSTYTRLVQEVFDLVDNTKYSRQSKQKFKRIISLVMCRGLVCLDCLEKNEMNTNQRFTLSEYERADLICDMESPKNYIKLFHYSAIQNK